MSDPISPLSQNKMWSLSWPTDIICYSNVLSSTEETENRKTAFSDLCRRGIYDWILADMSVLDEWRVL